MTIRERVDRIERQNRLLKFGLVFVFLISAGGAGVAGIAKWGSKPPDIIKAKEFHVVDEYGVSTVRLHSILGTGLVSTYLYGQPMVELGALEGRDGMVVTKNADGKPLVKLTATGGGDGMVVTNDTDGKRLVAIGGSTRGDGGFFSLQNKSGVEVIQAYADENGNGVLGVLNRDGKGRVIRPEP